MAIGELRKTISRLVGKPVRLTVTDNSLSMISIKNSGPGYHVRLHHMFLEADGLVLQALANFIRSRSTKAPPALRDFVTANSAKIRRSPGRPRRAVLRTAGRHFNLRDVLDSVNREYFRGELDCAITWGAKRRVGTKRTIRLGTYSEEAKAIRINPALDRSYVPNYVIHGIVYHEMLHHLLGAEYVNGRKVSHSRMFRQMESRYRHHQRLRRWVEKNRQRLMSA
jgi:hypothetical protein